MTTDEVIAQLTDRLAEPDLTPEQFDSLVNRIKVLRQMPQD